MIVKNIIDEDFSNYKRASMVVAFPHCTFKCEKECGKQLCQNSALATAPDIEISYKDIVGRYISNPLTSAVVFGGLEPFEDFDDLLGLVKEFRKVTDDDIVIYTGYYFNEISEKVEILKQIPNIIVKFGRFIPNQNKHYDDTIGVWLVSDNQVAVRIS